MKTSGHLVVDIFNPKLNRLVNGLGNYSSPTFEKRFRIASGNILVRYLTARYFPTTQQYEWVFYIEIYDGNTGNMIRKYTEEAIVQVIFPHEWRLLLTISGFEIVDEFGNFDRSPFKDDSPRMLFVAKKL